MAVKKRASGNAIIQTPSGITDAILDSLSRVANEPKFFPNGIDHLELEVDATVSKGFTFELKAWGPNTPQREYEHLSRTAVAASATSRMDLSNVQSALRYASAMENIAPPVAILDNVGPTPGPIAPAGLVPLAIPTLKSVADFWTDRCTGGDSYENNCAHYLSEAFIRAGFSELNSPAPCVHARCATPAARPIRARDMWCWFQSKATATSVTPTRNTGWWATFQLDETVYWGGHVALFDSDTWKFYGTGWFPNWSQHLYQW